MLLPLLRAGSGPQTSWERMQCNAMQRWALLHVGGAVLRTWLQSLLHYSSGVAHARAATAVSLVPAEKATIGSCKLGACPALALFGLPPAALLIKRPCHRRRPPLSGAEVLAAAAAKGRGLWPHVPVRGRLPPPPLPPPAKPTHPRW